MVGDGDGVADRVGVGVASVPLVVPVQAPSAMVVTARNMPSIGTLWSVGPTTMR